MRVPPIVTVLVILAASLLGQPTSTTTTPAPAPDCLIVVDAHGEGSWYCGDVVRVPKGSRIVAPMAACAEEDGSGGPLPCYWDASGRTGHERSHTVLLSSDGLLIRYNTGVTLVASS